MKISCMPTSSKVNFYTLAGEWVRQVGEIGGMALWDGKNNRGAYVSAGVYYYVVQQREGDVLETGKIIVSGD